MVSDQIGPVENQRDSRLEIGDRPPQGLNVRRRKVFVKSFGCQMNVYDAMKMADLLAPEGFQETANVADADLIILNTCHIRERATEKVFSELGQLRRIKLARMAEGLDTTIAVAGCVAQAEGAEITRRQSAVDIVVGPQNYHRLPRLLHEVDEIRRSGRIRPLIDTDFPVETKFEEPIRGKVLRLPAPAAFVTVQEGCDKFCSFCVVPYTRGAEMSRPVGQVLSEIEDLVASGVREVTLLGQNVNAYHGLQSDGRPGSLAALISAAAAVQGVERIRYTTSHPGDMDDDLIAAHGAIPALMPFLHLPVQSGSDRILARMNRRHTAADYLRLIDRLRRARPDIALSSDFIVGFPGETEADFQATLALIEAVGFASTFSFKYSARPGTPAADHTDAVAEPVKSERLARLQATTEAQRHRFNRLMVGQTLDVLFVKPGRHPGQIAGKSPFMQPVQVEAPADLIGQVQAVHITAVGSNSLFGKLPAQRALSREKQD